MGPGEAQAQRDLLPQYLNGTVAPVHLVIHQLDAVLHALWRQQFGLAHDSWKQQETEDEVRVCVRGCQLPTRFSSVPTHGP